MKCICAWCEKIIKDGEEPSTHGICEECLKTELKELEKEREKHAQTGKSNR